MKQIIFKGKYGWYIVAKNYKDKTDVAYINLFFAKCDEPIAQKMNEQGGQFAWVDLQEFTYSCYKGKIGITVFKYEMTTSPKESADQKKLVEEFNKDNNLNGKIDIEPDDLPFY